MPKNTITVFPIKLIVNIQCILIIVYFGIWKLYLYVASLQKSPLGDRNESGIIPNLIKSIY